ncbi:MULTISPECIES: tetratricopeptide repeat protein [unclassified Campylobacter]|uniref:tetratricopeptide repeat protein n=1 Tax=unclassified Campylobacter TaxID=2593542 RepID=UPI00167FFA94|nr:MULTISPECIES: tetratricopeptide repeat protein [unclassified Campylobacter]
MNKALFYLFYLIAMKIYHRDKDYEKARMYYEKASKYMPEHAKNYFKIGMCFFKVQDYSMAIDAFNHALELNPNNENWKQQLNQAEDANTSIFKAEKLWWKEILDLEHLINKKGKKYILLLDLATALQKMKYFQRAASVYEECIKLCENKEKLSTLYYEMGYCLQMLNENEKAKKAYENAIKQDSLASESKNAKLIGVGIFHEINGRWSLANKAYLKQLEIKISDELYDKIGLSYEILYDFENALIYYEKCLELNYQRALTHFNLARIYERKENFQKAVLHFEEAANRTNVKRTEYLYRLGLCLAKLGQEKRANEVFLQMQIVSVTTLVGGGEMNYDQSIEESQF